MGRGQILPIMAQHNSSGRAGIKEWGYNRSRETSGLDAGRISLSKVICQNLHRQGRAAILDELLTSEEVVIRET